jgi:multisubunit Na+/H+ antiporter MnhC subunit
LVNLLKEEPVAPVGHAFMVGMAVVCFAILALAVVLVGR